MTRSFYIFYSILLLANSGTAQHVRSAENRIKRHCLTAYDVTTRPVQNDSTKVVVSVALSLYHILDTNEKQQVITALYSMRLRWRDEYFVWNPEKFNGVSTIWLPIDKIWKPDIVIKNNADDTFKKLANTNAIISSNGMVLWMVPMITKTYCKLNVSFFPFDQQMCDIVFFSWTYNGYELDVIYNESDKNTIYYTSENQEWWVDRITVERHERYYVCCKEPYPDVTFTLHFRRRSLFYIFTLIYPCLLIYLVSFLGFFLPVESGEKINLEITILLALVVFLLVVSETLPPTPDGIPILGKLFGTTMLMVSVALIMAVIVTNVYFRKDLNRPVWPCLRRFIRQSAKTKIYKNGINGKRLQDDHTEDRRYTNNVEMETLTVLEPTSPRRDTIGSRQDCGTALGTHDTLSLDGLPNKARYAEEWRQLAKCVDRIFFWIFFIASVAAYTAMFAQVPAAAIEL